MKIGKKVFRQQKCAKCAISLPGCPLVANLILTASVAIGTRAGDSATAAALQNLCSGIFS
jgi:hypothetical protein